MQRLIIKKKTAKEGETSKPRTNCTSDKGLITRINRELKKPNSPKINDPMKNWANELNKSFKKKHEEMLTISGHRGNANQNLVKILPHSC
jgi:single-stranded DNA-specific DHH superfamily exonuclease